MDMLGPVEEGSLQGLSEEEKNEYLKEFLLPIIASVDEENATVIAEELLKVDEASIVSAINDANIMFDAIASTRERLGLYSCLLYIFSRQVDMLLWITVIRYVSVSTSLC